MSFSSDVHRIAEKMGDTVENVASATFIELFSAVIRDTPVDSGRLRGNWQTTKNSPATGELARTGGSGAIAEVHSKVDKLGTYYLTNNLPYATVAEFGGWGSGPKTTGGYSIQAPAGMVRKNVLRLTQILRKKAL